jgi:iron complex outermembrane receptor protein
MSIPNSDLVSETSWNFDLSYAYIPGSSIQFKTSLFYSRLRNTIQAVYGVDPQNSAIYQFQNTGDAQFYGWEAEFRWDPVAAMQTEVQYTYTERQNLSNPDIIFTDVPRHKLYTYITYNPLSRVSLSLNGMFNSPRISTSSGIYSTDAFVTLDFRTSVSLLSNLSVSASVTNLLDADFSFVEGYPAPGRQFFLGLSFNTP